MISSIKPVRSVHRTVGTSTLLEIFVSLSSRCRPSLLVQRSRPVDGFVSGFFRTLSLLRPFANLLQHANLEEDSSSGCHSDQDLLAYRHNPSPFKFFFISTTFFGRPRGVVTSSSTRTAARFIVVGLVISFKLLTFFLNSSYPNCAK